MKKTLKMIALLFGVATIAVCAISCDNKAKKEADEAAKQEMLQKQQEEAQREEARQAEAMYQQKRAMSSLVGTYTLDMGGSSGQETGLEILEDGRVLKWWRADKIRKEYIGDVNLLSDKTFQIPIADYSDVKSITLAYYSAGSEDERAGRASFWPNYDHSRVHELLFERVSYGLCVYESISKYKNKDVSSSYHYAKFYKQ
ncbi:MAG: hypothetical protein SPJ54_04420 [Candidatus Onthomorpha sp.]|nr:hypothetical protein [Candidatus Onthomorpha sp.]